MKRWILISMLVIQSLITATVIAQGAATTVCSDGCNYTTIQSAIDDADHGDLIEVYSGTYIENVNVTKQLIITGMNMGGGQTVVNSSGNGSAILLSADGIILKGFSVTGSDQWLDAGIKVISNNNILSGNSALNNNYGIYLSNCNNNTLNNNTARENEYGFVIRDSEGNKLTNNNASKNSQGIYLINSDNNTLNNNDAVNNNEGINIIYSDNNTLSDNNFSKNYRGIYLMGSGSNMLSGNNALNNNFGIRFENSNYNSLSNNNISYNRIDGLYLKCSSNNTLSSNNILNNDNYGIGLSDSDNNSIYLNNVIQNNISVNSNNLTNIWNSTTTINYTYNDTQFTNYLGNYWSDYTGLDDNEDGIGDTSHDQDNYPLMKRFDNYLQVDIFDNNMYYYSDKGNGLSNIMIRTIDWEGSSSAYLIFQTKYDIKPGDFALVFFTENNKTLEGYIFIGTQPNWTIEMVNLSQFAGRDGSIGFYYQTDDSEIGDGFYVDNIQIYTDTETIFFDNAQNGPDKWTLDGFLYCSDDSLK